jgi:3-hydroxyacyl-CoA dehydrogenase / 3-hydroxy-2-methylbutyryl-CoA dehydrogenase|eukprot:g1279.t1
MARAGKTYFITGGASGLGLATVRRLHSEGANVAVIDLNEKQGKAVEAELGSDRCFFIKTNMTQEESVAAAVDATVERFGGLHGCLNSAGIGSAEKTVSKKGKPMRSKTWDFVLKLNAYGTFYGSAYCAAAMSKMPPGPDGMRGVIVNVSSIAGIEGQKGQLAYSASKGAVIGMTLPMARDLGRYNIRVMTICPGIMDTPLMQAAPEKVRQGLLKGVVAPLRFGHTSEFAKLVTSIIDNNYLNGEVIRMDGGLRFAHL